MKRETEASVGETTHHRRRKRRRKRRLTVPVPIVFYTTGALSVMSSALAYLRGGWAVFFSMGMCVLLLAVLIINERTGFSRSRRMRRAHEARDKLSIFEAGVLFVLLLLGIFVSIFMWVT